jgi:hypothetical protein
MDRSRVAVRREFICRRLIHEGGGCKVFFRRRIRKMPPRIAKEWHQIWPEGDEFPSGEGRGLRL